MEPLELHSDFKDFLRSLNSFGVEYLLIGGYAVGYHGHVRTTGDIDVWIAVDPKNAERVVAALRNFGFGTGIRPEMFLERDKIFRMGIPPVRIEILTTISGLEFADAYSRRVRGAIDGVEVDLISLSDLKVNKKASGRHKDLADLDELG
jgi:predicted nucleotidyltransferase